MESADAEPVPGHEFPLASGWVWIAKHLSGELSEDEDAAFARWLSGDPSRADAVARIRASWDGQKRVPSSVNTETALTKLFERAGTPWPAGDSSALPNRGASMARRPWEYSKYSTPRRRWSTSVFAGAAVLLLALIVGNAWRLGDRSPAGVTHVYTTNDTQQGILPLSDGSRVLLSPGTTLRTVDFGNRSRTMILDRGEAYFDVAPSSDAPFAVTSGSVTAQVLGTAFLVRRYVGEHRVRVSVVDGKVHVTSLGRPATEAILTAGYVGEITDSTTQAVTIDDLSPRIEWQHDQMVFRDTPVATVLHTLERWYGFRFICADSALPLRNVTIVLNTSSSASALAKLEQILSVNLTVVGDTITLTPHGRSTKEAPLGRHYDVWTFPTEVGR
jgi:transmembrane sensor